MKRILFFIGTLKAGGGEKVILILTKALVELGYSCEILTYYNREIFYKVNEKIKINSIEASTHSKNLLKNLLWLRKYIQKDIDLIISFHATLNTLMLLAKLGIKIPIVVSDRSDPHFAPKNVMIRLLRNYLYEKANDVVVQTETNGEYFSKSIQKKIHVIGNPINLGENIGLGLRIPKEKIIVSVGRLIKLKNQEMLIKAFSKVHRKYPDYKLIIYGEGDYRKDLEVLISNLSLQSYVSLPGNIDHIAEAIAHAEMFVMTSNHEGLSNALMEAMALGLSVISTRVSGARDIIINGKNGMLVDIGEESQLEKAMLQYIENNELRLSCAQNAIRIVENFDEKKITNQWLNVINQYR